MTNQVKFLIFAMAAVFLLAAGVALAQEELATTTVDVSQEINLDGNIQAQDLEVSEPGILPNSPFYFLKNWARGIQQLITFNPVKKAELNLRFTNEKLLEARKVSEKTKDPEVLKRAVENYQKEIEKLKNQTDKIKDKANQNEEVGKFLDKFIKQQTLQQRILEKLETQVPTQALEKIEIVREEHLQIFGEVMTWLEDKNEIQKRLEKNIEEIRGSDFKDFKNLEFLKALEEKAPEAAREAIRVTQDNILNRLGDKLEKMAPDQQEKFKEYAEKISTAKDRQIEILDSLLEKMKIATSTENLRHLIEKLDEGKENILEKITPEESKEQIKKAKEMIDGVEKLLQERPELLKEPAISQLLENAKKHLILAEESQKNEKYGAAFGHANASLQDAENALRKITAFRASQGPPVRVDARFYPDVKTQLLAGDLLAMPAVRQASDSAMTVDHWKFQNAITALNSVDKNEIGVKKGIVLSAVDDVKNLIGAIPSDVDWITYNMEPGMTPSTDFADPVSSVKQFADVVRASGRKIGFAPLRSFIDNNQGTQQMSDIINSVDGIMYQGQLLLPNIGEDAFVQTVQEKYAYVKSVNPNVEFSLQLWLGRQTPQEMISAFNRLTNSMDWAGIGTHDINKTSQVKEVLSGLSWRQQSSPTPIPIPIPGSKFPLGINISLSGATYDFWNTHALPTDIVSSYTKDIDLLTRAIAGVKFLFTHPNTPESDMDLAVSKNIGYVTANIETTDLDLQIASESAQYSMAKARGLKFIFAPMGHILEESYSYQDYAMLKNTDYIFYQTQYLQDSSRNLGTTDPSIQIANYAVRVKALISKIRPYIVEHKVWVQVSVNPPDNRCITADRVIQYIDSIEDGSQNSPDGIIIFYASKYDTTGDRQDDGNCLSKGFPSRVDVMKQVIEHYRSSVIPSPSCLPRPACLDSAPRCLLPEPAEGWCPFTQPRACTADAKQCPDGSYVSRTGPNCEFAPCPGQ
ncbi:MAG: DUF5667 domain-containing protein [bacterium]|nr:DUF5667 domain-containing protein [bacterium]